MSRGRRTARSTIVHNVRVPGIPAVAAVLLEGDRIGGIGTLEDAKGLAPDAVEVDGSGHWLLPGWIDIQVNDIAWLAGGPRAPEEHRSRIREVLRYQAARGTTGVILATLAAPEDEVASYLRGAALARAGGEPLDSGFLGALVEGTFMNPALCGAHNADHVRPPDRRLLEKLLGTGGVRMLNVAPETSPEALAVIEEAARRGVVVGCGHAKPSGERVREAVARGLAYVIHLGNGPTGSSLKGFARGGLLEEALASDRLVVSLILDGVHLDRRLVRDILARKETSRVVGTSDAGFATGCPREEFTVFGVRGRPSPDGRYLEVVPPAGARPANPFSSDAAVLFGSAVGMREVFENILNWQTVEMEGIYHRRHPALPFIEALAAAVEITSTNPARLLRESERGTLRTGNRADAILASIEGEPGAYRVTVHRVWLAGLLVEPAAAGG